MRRQEEEHGPVLIMNKIKVILVASFAIFACLFLAPHGTTQTKIETAGQKFKNIQVLNDMPADQLGKVMNIMSASLGFNCTGCHVSFERDFDKDDNEHKVIARRMLAMTFDLNKRYFNGRPEISCNTCHRGQEQPVSIPNLNALVVSERPAQPKVKPTATDILAKYDAAIGGRAKAAANAGRTITATRIESDGKNTELEKLNQSPGKLSVETTYGKFVVVESFNGSIVTKTGDGKPINLQADEAAQIKREAQLFGNPDLGSVYSKLDYRFSDMLNGEPVYLVTGTLADGSRERLFFSSITGLLVRRVASTQTVLGPFQFQVDYSGYKSFGGVKLPTFVRFSRPGLSWSRRIDKVRIKAG